MSNYLSDNRTLKKDKIEVLMNAHLVTKINFIKDGKHVFYRDHLKKMVESNVREKSIDFNNIITLNNDLDETRSWVSLKCEHLYLYWNVISFKFIHPI